MTDTERLKDLNSRAEDLSSDERRELIRLQDPAVQQRHAVEQGDEEERRAAWLDAQQAAQSRMLARGAEEPTDPAALGPSTEEKRLAALRTKTIESLSSDERKELVGLQAKHPAAPAATAAPPAPSQEPPGGGTATSRVNIPDETTDSGAGGGPGNRPMGGRGGVLIPGGMMPHSMKTTVKEGKVVPAETKAALEVGTALRGEAAKGEHEADRKLYEDTKYLREAELHAASDAATAHADVQARRDAEVRMRLDQIEATNSELAAGIDPNKFWHDRGAFAQVLGIFSTALGAAGASLSGGPNHAGQLIDNAIDRDIKAQVANREGKQALMKGQMSLLRLHQERLGAEDKAIDATKLAYYENILQQLEIYKADHGNQVNESKFLALNADIVERYGELRNRLGIQEQAEKSHEFVQQYRNPQVVGGASAAKKDDVKWLAKEYADKKVPESLARLQEIDRTLDAFGSGEIEGTGLGADVAFGINRRLGKAVFGQTASANRQTLATLKNELRHEIAGSALSPAEKAYNEDALEGAGDAEAVRGVLHSVRRTVVNKAANLRAGVPPEAQEQYEEQGGSVTRGATQLNKPSSTQHRGR